MATSSPRRIFLGASLRLRSLVLFSAFLGIVATPMLAQAITRDVPQKISVCQILKASLPASAIKHQSASSPDTKRIQDALSLCEPGKALVLQADKQNDAFLSAPLVIPRGVVLFVEKGATLYASRNPRDYDLWPRSCGTDSSAHQGCKPFLFSYQAAYSGVMGDGVIDGQGGAVLVSQSKSWWQLGAESSGSGKTIAVPDLVSSYESQFFSVRGVHLRNAAGVHLALYKTIGFQGSNISIDAPVAAKDSSGILLSNSPGTTLSGLSIHVPGRAVDLRASILGNTSYVKMSDLHIQGGTGLSLGDPVYGNVSTVNIDHLSINNASQGFFFNLRGTKGGHLHHIGVHDACLTGVAQPLAVDAGGSAFLHQLPAETQTTWTAVTVAGQGTLDAQGVHISNSASCASADSQSTVTHTVWQLDLSGIQHPGTRSRLVVAKDGSGDYRSIEQAVEALPNSGGEIDVKPGIYREVVTIRKPHVHLHGTDPDPSKTVVVFDHTGPKNGGTFNSATVFVEADNVTIDHMTISNDAGNKGQAVALAVTADRGIFQHLRLLGAQDTLFAAARYCYGDYGPCIPTRQYFSDSYIAGNTDFIFGDSQAVFERCTLHGIPGKGVMYTAQGKHYAEQKSGYVFDHCVLTADPSDTHITLGRPWRPHATVVYLDCDIKASVIPAGWTEWPRFGVPSLPIAYYAEYHSTGPGASPETREPYSHQLTRNEAEQWLPRHFLAGSDGWNPVSHP